VKLIVRRPKLGQSEWKGTAARLSRRRRSGNASTADPAGFDPEIIDDRIVAAVINLTR